MRKWVYTMSDLNVVRSDFLSFATALAILLGIGGGASSAMAQDSVDIQFQPGATSTTINGSVRGDEYIDYVVNARGGQTMVVSLAVTGTNGNGTAYFNILPAGQDYGGPYIGHMDDDNRAEITVPSDGDWSIRVYLMGNDRDAGKTVGYSIDVYIAPSDAAPSAGSEPTTTSERVQFEGGSSGAELTDTLTPGSSKRYVLNAGDGQFLYVRVAPQGPDVYYQIFNPDNSFLLDQMTSNQEYRGQLWQSGDHVIEVINRGSSNVSYNVIFGVE